MRNKNFNIVILLALSAFCICLLFARIIFFRQLKFSFLVWNLILAWIPYLISRMSLTFLKKKSKMFFIWIALFLWFIFFPNAPYILTDLIHLQHLNVAPLWYEAIMIFSFAWTGLILSFYSLTNIQTLVTEMYGKVLGWIVIIFSIILSGFGIYIGRFLRWNSWDIFFDTRNLFKDIFERIIDPFAHPRTITVTLVFSIFLLLSYLLFNNKNQTDGNEIV